MPLPFAMLERLYVHNFRSLENFEFKPGDEPSVLIIGKNGSGKSTLARVLATFQRIGRGVSRIGDLVKPSDCTQGRTAVPMRFELQVTLDGQCFDYSLALELPERFKELRVRDESLQLDGRFIYTREHAQVTMPRQGAPAGDAQFNIDWHLVALNVIQDAAASTAIATFRRWLASMVLLAPLPTLIAGEAHAETLEPLADGSNFPDWLAGLLAQYPSAYMDIVTHLQKIMPDLHQFRNVLIGRDAKALMVEFRQGSASLELAFDALSDGEKCFFVCAVLLAANRAYGPLLAFWDEPDSHLAMAEVRHFAMALRRAFREQGQVIITSHNAETIRSFSNDNTWVLERQNHLEPTVLRPLGDLAVDGDLVQAILSGELAA